MELFKELSFDLNVPRHFIENEGAWIGFPLSMDQTISVQIRSLYHAPIAIIGSKSTRLNENGAIYIIIVREYLKFALENTRNCPFEVDTVGPSPMHEKFSIFSSKEDSVFHDYGIRQGVEKSAGYDWMTIPLYMDGDDVDEKNSRNNKQTFR